MGYLDCKKFFFTYDLLFQDNVLDKELTDQKVLMFWRILKHTKDCIKVMSHLYFAQHRLALLLQILLIS